VDGSPKKSHKERKSLVAIKKERATTKSIDCTSSVEPCLLNQRAGAGRKNPLLRFDPATQFHHCLFVELADSGFAHTQAFSDFLQPQILKVVEPQYLALAGLQLLDVRAQ
jgi:hypothetical protein